MPVVFCPLASGSDGNSVYIGADGTHVLIDAGLSGKAMEEALDIIRLPPGLLDAIFITHEHGDHIQGAGVLSRRYRIPVYATKKTWAYMDRKSLLGRIAPENKRILPSEGGACALKGLEVRHFPIPHDAIDPVAYTIKTARHKISVATDMGHVTDIIKENLSGSDVLYVESNHDLDMLKNGPYPRELKARVMGLKGHLSNASAGRLIADVMSERLKYVYLGHMSEENNRPLIALDTVSNILAADNIVPGVNVRLYLAHRGMVSDALRLE
ncbi:MAG: MBL fold metallo-hydrolase [Clostridiales bacterium]|nr:MBL fold metallo-hydrolase [Clostridiales bacterium]